MTKNIITLVAAIAFLASANLAQAQVTNSESNVVDNSGGGANLNGFVTNDLTIDFTGQYSGAQLRIDLTQGSIYRDSFGNANGAPPNPAFFGAAPSLEFDSFVAQGNVGSGGPDGEPLPGGGAVDLGGAAAATWAPIAGGGTTINQAWNPAGGQIVQDKNGFLIARITLSDDALGTATWLASVEGQISRFEMGITNGVIGIPEPTTLALGGLAMIGLISRRRRS